VTQGSEAVHLSFTERPGCGHLGSLAFLSSVHWCPGRPGSCREVPS
jgi:hypothetical protein